MIKILLVFFIHFLNGKDYVVFHRLHKTNSVFAHFLAQLTAVLLPITLYGVVVCIIGVGVVVNKS